MLHQGLHIFAPLPVIAHTQSYASAGGDLTDASLKKLVLFNLGSCAKKVYFGSF